MCDIFVSGLWRMQVSSGSWLVHTGIWYGPHLKKYCEHLNQKNQISAVNSKSSTKANSMKVGLRCIHIRQSVSCPSTAGYTLSALAWLEDMGFGRVQQTDINVTVCGGFALNSSRQQHKKSRWRPMEIFATVSLIADIKELLNNVGERWKNYGTTFESAGNIL